MSADALSHKIRVGPAGWSYPDWEGIVYPLRKSKGFHRASYLADFFDTIEINTTFYHPTNAETVKDWIRRVEHNPDFKFTAKLWRRFTHERSADRQDEKVLKDCIEPLMHAGRLGALLLQFPWSFKNAKENREFLGGLIMQFMEYPLVVEVRHSSWNDPQSFRLLENLGVGFCNIDQPVIGRSLGATQQVTSPVGYVRLHGRNYNQWFTAGENGEERYNYYYSKPELEPWVERIDAVAERTAEVYVIANNHFQGKAVANGLQLQNMLCGAPVRVPDTLLARYPELAEIRAAEAAVASPGKSGLLFK